MTYISAHQIRKLFLVLEKIDMVFANEAHLIPCVFCGGRLDVANYSRKLRGTGQAEPVTKFSLCCRQEGCRHRADVPSIRFLGGFVFSSVFVLLVSGLMNGDHRRLRNLVRRFEISWRSLKRWQTFWNGIFEQTSFWKEHKGKHPGFFHQVQYCR